MPPSPIIPKETFRKVVLFLEPHLGDTDSRRALLEYAFYGTNFSIDTSGAKDVFTHRLVHELIRAGYINREPALVTLLRTLRETVNQPDLDDLLDEVVQCYRGSAGGRSGSATATVTTEIPQTIFDTQNYIDTPTPVGRQDIMRWAFAVMNVDIVRFSTLSVADQKKLYDQFKALLTIATDPYQDDNTLMFWSPAGDGGSLTVQNLTYALAIAISLSYVVNEYNMSQPKIELHLRIGLHLGPVFISQDFDKRLNVWGHGINMASRVATLAKPGQILASEEFCKNLDLLPNQLSVDVTLGEMTFTVTHIGEWMVKHGVALNIYNIHNSQIGIDVPEDHDAWAYLFNIPMERTVDDYRNLLIVSQNRDTAVRNVNALRTITIAKRLLDILPEVTVRNGGVMTEDERFATETIRRVANASVQQADGYFHYFLSNLGDDALFYFLQNAKITRYAQGQTIFERQDPADHLLVLISGTIAVQNAYITKQRQARDGVILGEMGLFSPTHKRTARVSAVTDVIAFCIGYDKLARSRQNGQFSFGANDSAIEVIESLLWREVYLGNVIENFLHTHPLFKSLNSEQKSRLLDRSRYMPEDLGKNPFIRHSDFDFGVLFVTNGNIEVVFQMNSGSTFPIIFSPGDVPGLVNVNDSLGLVKMAALAGDHEPYIQRIISWELSQDAQFVKVSWRQIRELMDNDPDFRLKCIQYYNQNTVPAWGFMPKPIPEDA